MDLNTTSSRVKIIDFLLEISIPSQGVKSYTSKSIICFKKHIIFTHVKAWSFGHSCVSWCLWGNSGSYPNSLAPQNAKWPFSYTKQASRSVTNYVNEIAEELYDKNLKVNCYVQFCSSLKSKSKMTRIESRTDHQHISLPLLQVGVWSNELAPTNSSSIACGVLWPWASNTCHKSK